MATIKSYTDLNQSRTLAEFLPHESADMYYDDIIDRITGELFVPDDGSTIKVGRGVGGSIAAWSLAALLEVLPSATLDSSDDHYYRLHCMKRFTEWFDNPIDAAFEMIIKLYQQKLL